MTLLQELGRHEGVGVALLENSLILSGRGSTLQDVNPDSFPARAELNSLPAVESDLKGYSFEQLADSSGVINLEVDGGTIQGVRHEDGLVGYLGEDGYYLVFARFEKSFGGVGAVGAPNELILSVERVLNDSELEDLIAPNHSVGLTAKFSFDPNLTLQQIAATLSGFELKDLKNGCGQGLVDQNEQICVRVEHVEDESIVFVELLHPSKLLSAKLDASLRSIASTYNDLFPNFQIADAVIENLRGVAELSIKS